MEDFTLSKQQSRKFLEEIIKIPNCELEIAKLSKLEFLRKIVNNWHKYVPFQNIEQLFLTKREKRLPTVTEIIEIQLQGKGGVCIYNAIFMYLLLKSLDYDTYITIGNVFIHHDHAIVVANNVEENGDSYLVEVGSGWPCFAPIPLRHLTSDLSTAKIYKSSYITYTYLKEDNLIVRYNRKNIIENNNLNLKGDWVKNNWTDLQPVKMEYLFSKQANIWKTCVDVTCGLHTRIWTAVLYPENKCTSVRCKVLSWDENGDRMNKDLKDKCEVVENIKRLFPMIDEASVNEAIDFVEENVSIYGEK